MIWLVLFLWWALGMGYLFWLANDEQRWLSWYASKTHPTFYERVLMFPASFSIIMAKVFYFLVVGIWASKKDKNE